MVDLKKIQECAGFFKNMDPRVYETFLRHLDAYVHEITVAVTEASQADILPAQGRAQQARKFLQLFMEPREPNKPTP